MDLFQIWDPRCSMLTIVIFFFPPPQRRVLLRPRKKKVSSLPQETGKGRNKKNQKRRARCTHAGDLHQINKLVPSMSGKGGREIGDILELAEWVVQLDLPWLGIACRFPYPYPQFHFLVYTRRPRNWPEPGAVYQFAAICPPDL